MTYYRRPTNINPFAIRLTITAFVSGLHRVSGFGVFLLLPLMLWLLESSLSPEGFEAIGRLIQHPIVGMGIALLIAGLLYHFVAGIRHMLFDIHIGDSLRGGRIGAYLVLFLSAVLFFGAGFWIWG